MPSEEDNSGDKNYVLVPVIVSFDDSYKESVADRTPNNDSEMREAAVQMLFSSEIDAVGNIKHSNDVEDLTGSQTVEI